MAGGQIIRDRRLLVADTNVVVSGLCWRGSPAILIDACLDARLQLVSSPALLDELARVLHYPRLARHLPTIPDDLLRLVAGASLVVHPTRLVAVATDPTDNRVLEAALSAGADAIVSGDKRHLRPLDEYEGIPIRTPAELVAAWELAPPSEPA